MIQERATRARAIVLGLVIVGVLFAVGVIEAAGSPGALPPEGAMHVDPENPRQERVVPIEGGYERTILEIGDIDPEEVER